MRRKKAGLGEAQWEVLHWVSEHYPVTVAQVAEAFAASHGLARTTVLTVMEKLREKGYLTRAKNGHIYEYSPAVSKTQMVREQVGQFVQGTLGGSFAPLLAYLAEETEVSQDQLSELKRLVQELEQGQNQKGERPSPPTRDLSASQTRGKGDE